MREARPAFGRGGSGRGALLCLAVAALLASGCRACRERPDPAVVAARKEQRLLEKIEGLHRRQQEVAQKLARAEQQLARLRAQRHELQKLHEDRTPRVMHPAEQ